MKKLVGHTDFLARVRSGAWNLAKQLPLGLGLLLILCAAGLLTLLAFAFMMLPASKLFALRGYYDMPDEPPGGRGLYFFICLMSAWAMGLTLTALDRWWERLWHSEPAVLQLTIRQLAGGWRTKLPVLAGRTAAKLYDISFWIMLWAFGMLTLARLAHDRAFKPAAIMVANHIRDQAGHALYRIGAEAAHLPALIAPPAMLLIFSFFFYAILKFLGTGRT